MQVRTKLIVSYAFVIALCLILAAAATTFLLRRFQNTLEREGIQIIAETTALVLHDNFDPKTFDAATQVAKTAAQTNTRIVVVSASLRDLTGGQQRANTRPLAGTVIQDSSGRLPPGATVALPREIYVTWRDRAAAQATRVATPTTIASAPNRNANLSLPSPLRHSLNLGDGAMTETALVPLRAERGEPNQSFRVVIVGEPTGSVDRPLPQLVSRLLWAAAIAFLISILVALILARSITQPLIALTNATRAIARGNFAQRVPATGGGEVGELANSFNQMAAEIEQTRRREKELLANISHDLKTPLTSIQGFSSALIDGTSPPEAYPTVARIIHDESVRMGRLVGEIVQLSRLDAGEVSLSLAPVEVGALLRENAQRFEQAALTAGVTIRVDLLADRPLWIAGDRSRLDQVLGNLLENALRYTPPNGRISLVASASNAAGQDSIIIQVRDTGDGIAASDLPHIFERFYQADKSRANGRAGSGLGLAIVKELVERHGGSVRAESTLGAGTTIVISLPRAAIPVEQTRPASDLVSASGGREYDQDSRR